MGILCYLCFSVYRQNHHRNQYITSKRWGYLYFETTKNCNRASLRYSKKVKGSRTTTEDIPKIPTPLHATSRGGRGRFVSNANSHLSPKEERKIGITLGYPEYLSDAKRAWKPLHYWGNRFIRELTNATFLSHGLQSGVGCFPMSSHLHIHIVKYLFIYRED